MHTQCKILISNHAKRRLSERIPGLGKNDYRQYVRAARYQGETIAQIARNNPELAEKLSTRFPFNNSEQLRLYKGNLFIFAGGGGKARTLVTVINLPKNFMEEKQMDKFNYDKAEADLYDVGCPYSEEIYEYGSDRGRDEFLRENGLNPEKYYDHSNDGSHGPQNNGGGCYLTTACVKAKNLPDDCDELQTLRAYRDEHLSQTEEGKMAINRYYDVAPKIVEAIDKEPNASSIWNRLYNELVVPCVTFIKAEQYDKAYELYRDTTFMLEKEYLK